MFCTNPSDTCWRPLFLAPLRPQISASSRVAAAAGGRPQRREQECQARLPSMSHNVRVTQSDPARNAASNWLRPDLILPLTHIPSASINPDPTQRKFHLKSVPHKTSTNKSAKQPALIPRMLLKSSIKHWIPRNTAPFPDPSITAHTNFQFFTKSRRIS